MFWWLMKFVVLGPFLRLTFRPRAEGLEHIPADGPALLVANHLSFLDDLLLPLVIPGRKVVFLGKAEYFEKWYLRWFYRGANVIPVRRGGGSASEAARRVERAERSRSLPRAATAARRTAAASSVATASFKAETASIARR